MVGLKPLAETVAPGQVSFQSDKQILKIPFLCLHAENNKQLVTQVEMQLVPNSTPLQFLLKNASDPAGTAIFSWAIAQNKGAVLLSNRQAFENLAAISDLSGVSGVRELKFVMTDLDSHYPVLYFMNSVATPLHYDFVRDVLKRYQGLTYDQGLTRFIAETYFREARRYLVGSVVAYDNYSETDSSLQQGLYALEFWPTDPVPEQLIEHAYHSITVALPFLAGALAYHPVGNTHESEFAGFAEQFAAKNIRSIDTDSLFAQLDSVILNKGEAYGHLKLINPGDPDPGAEIIAIYTFIPNTLGHVGGIITEQPQTPAKNQGNGA